MDRRNPFDDALTAEEEGFLKTGKSSPRPKNAKRAATKAKPPTKEPPMSKPALKNFREDLPTQRIPQPLSTAVNWANLSVRIHPDIAGATLRALTERKIARIAPWTQQDIVAEAITEWLTKHGYL